MRQNAKCTTQRGFSLIELAVVLLILSILLGLGLGAINSQITKSNYETTFRHRDNIKDALITYLRVNQRLPCPSNVALDGTEAINGPGTACNPNVVAGRTNFGILPWRTLGLERTTALDGWDTYFSYMVSDGVGTNDWIATTGIRATNTGALVRRENNLTPPPATLDTGGYAFALISHGPNASGGFTAKLFPNAAPPIANVEELINNGSTADIFFAGEPKPNYDDIVIGVTADDLLSTLIADGVFDDPTKTTRTIVEDTFNQVIGDTLTNKFPGTAGTHCTSTTDPCYRYNVTNNVGTVNDDWGNPLNVNATGILSEVAGPPPSPAPTTTTGITVQSYGPDGSDNACGVNTDDVCRMVNAAQLRGLIARASGFN